MSRKKKKKNRLVRKKLKTLFIKLSLCMPSRTLGVHYRYYDFLIVQLFICFNNKITRKIFYGVFPPPPSRVFIAIRRFSRRIRNTNSNTFFNTFYTLFTLAELFFFSFISTPLLVIREITINDTSILKCHPPLLRSTKIREKKNRRRP